MPTLVNLTFDVADLIGADFDVRRTKVWVETNIASGSVIDTTGKVVRLGDVKATVGTDGKGTFTGLFATNSTDLNPTGFLYQVYVDYATRADGRKLWSSGWFPLTATSDLALVTPVVGGPVNSTDDAVIASRVNDSGSQTRAALRGVLTSPLTLYVAPTGSDANTGREVGRPKATVAAALTALGANKGTVRLSGETHTLTSGITLDITKHRLLGEPGTVLDYTPLTGVAVTVIGSAPTPYDQRSFGGLEKVRIKGAGKVNATTGLREHVASGGAVSHASFRDVTIHGFGVGVSHGDNAYLIDHYGFDVYGCGVAVDAPAGTTNAGEAVRYFGGAFFNSDLGVRAKNSIGEMQFLGSSFDYNTKQFEVDGSRVELHGCHVEAGKTDHPATPITVAGNGGTFRMLGGWMVQTGAPGASTNPYVVDNSGTGLAVLDSVYMNNLQTSTGQFATGTGMVLVGRTSSTTVTDNPRILSSEMNLMADGGFEATTVRDDVFILGDTQAITSRVAGANINLSTDIAQFRSGARALKAAKTFGGGSACEFAIALPATPGAMVASRLYYRKPGTETGTIYIESQLCKLRVNGDGVPVPEARLTLGSTTIDLTGADTGWIGRSDGGARVPSWATHYLLTFNLTSFVGPGNFWIDDVLVTVM